VIRRRVVVSGLVQGVGFRFSCADAAQRAGVRGWAANRSDGTVEAVFEGAPDAVAAMVRWCGRGPRYAEVTGVDVHEEEPEGLTGFGTY
jgi:acylphosphatase